MGLFTIKIDGVRYTHAQARLHIKRLEQEIETLNTELDARIKQVDDLSGQLFVSRRLYNEAKAELNKVKPKRGKGGRFVKKNSS